MKKVLTFLMAFVFSAALYAQTNLTTAVDFTVTDTQGNVHNLFSYLNEGKFVVLDFFFTT